MNISQQNKKKQQEQKLLHAYNALSPMMKFIFSAEAQLRYAVDKSLKPIILDLLQADHLVSNIFKHPYNTEAQAELLITQTISSYKRKDKILNYAINALAIGDAIVFRMAYAHGQLHPSMVGFDVKHPYLVQSEELQQQIAFLKRMNRTPFTMNNPEYSKYYKKWILNTSNAINFDKRRKNYTIALTTVMHDLNIEFKRIPLPHTGVGRAFIKEKSRERS